MDEQIRQRHPFEVPCKSCGQPVVWFRTRAGCATGRRNSVSPVLSPSTHLSDDELVALKMINFNRILHETEGWAFFAWHRKRWWDQAFTRHSVKGLGLDAYDVSVCQVYYMNGGLVFVCRAIWSNPHER